MAKIERTSLVERIRTQLLADLAAGRFGDLMPSMRRLAQDLGVSVPTLGLALQALAEEGWISPQGDRRRWKVERRPSRLPVRSPGAGVSRGAGIRRKKLLFLVPRSMDEPSASWMGIFQDLLRSLDPNDWEVVQWSEKYLRTTRARKSWDTMRQLLQPDYMIAYLGMPVLEDWARKRGVPTLFVGGVSNGRVAIIGASFSQMLREAITRMLVMGHRKIL
ncbi:MAG: GntR family transcriptional regulator, partial [Akkermansiaceae bacterium]|nr:GntR family transcriptional regulator [Akkermansiaceae bacterium]